MSQNDVSGGAVHDLPEDLKKALLSNAEALQTWQDITALARTEWIAWIEDAKKLETRNKRIAVGIENLTEGKRRPCCWPGYKNVDKYKKQKK
jgi:uncharacterized protein YdeI (YjbR/CyaY-like superfamily)